MIILTFDTDWAPVFVIQQTLEILTRHSLKGTMFCTNTLEFEPPSCIELGLHPNFMADSTQGGNPGEILANLKESFPSAKGARTHRLYWDSSLQEEYCANDLLYDCSVFLPFHPHLQPVEGAAGITRIPYWYSDNIHFQRAWAFDDVDLPGLHSPGLKVFDFHPIHIYLNTPNMEYYKDVCRNINIPSADAASLERYINPDEGMRTWFESFCKYLSKNNLGQTRLEDLIG